MDKILELYRRTPKTLELTDIDTTLYIKQILRSCVPDARVDALIGMNPMHAVLLLGEAGTGKQTMADAVACEMQKTVDAEKFLYISLSLWLCVGEKSIDFGENIQRLFEEIAKEAVCRPVLVFLDDLDAVGQDSTAAYMVYQCIHSMKESQVPCVLICAAQDDAQIPEPLKKLLIICKTEKPDTLARANYFKRTLAKADVCEHYLTADVMAQMTYGFTYSQLKLCIQIVLMGLKQEILSGNPKALVTKKMFEYNVEQMRKTMMKKVVLQADAVHHGTEYSTFAEKESASATQNYTLKTEGENIRLLKPTDDTDEAQPQKSYLEMFEELEDLDEF